MIDSVSLSKAMSHALRHEPWLYGIEINNEGWTDVAELLSALVGANPHWSHLTERDLDEVIERSSKRRFEIVDGKIRALYGHSTPEQIKKQLAQPPPELFHCASPEKLELIRREGLKPMARQYVHLAVNPEIALEAGRRKHPKPILLCVDAERAWLAEVPFYCGNDVIWLAGPVPPEFLIERFPG